MRYHSNELDHLEPADVLVIGTGIAGATAAIKAAEAGLDVLVLTRSSDLNSSSSAWAQGGIIYEGENDSPTLLAQDIFEAGARTGLRAAIDLLATEGPRRVREVLLSESPENGGIPFDRNALGGLDLTEEAAHSVPRIIHVEDLTGRAIQDYLLKRLARQKGIRVLPNVTAVDLLTLSHHGKDPEDRYRPVTVVGAYVLHLESGRVFPVMAREVILATGGAGQVYLHTTNPEGARGDGYAMCWRANIRLSHMEYVQFHPTALYTERGRRLLISEAMRGEGARLIDKEGRQFMHKYDPRGSLAPRDVVARGIHEEMLQTGEPCMYLDITHKPSDWIRERFPHISRVCLERAGIDIATQPIPVVPAAHYMCGGVLVDLDGRTSAERLWAVGEVACTGVHGANRLASTSLLEGLVWGARAAEAIVEKIARGGEWRMPKIAPWKMAREQPDPALIHQDWNTIKYTMWNYVGLVRSSRRLGRARYLLRELELEIEDFYSNSVPTDTLIGLRNGITTARAILMAAVSNRRSEGCHYRVD